jgi:DNA replicative helicase MCM subunit Mcm2 (Cdc46/Mcm family)
MRNMIGGRGVRFNINIDELRQFNPRLANMVLKNPIQAVKMFEDQLNATIRGMNEGNGGKGG